MSGGGKLEPLFNLRKVLQEGAIEAGGHGFEGRRIGEDLRSTEDEDTSGVRAKLKKS